MEKEFLYLAAIDMEETIANILMYISAYSKPETVKYGSIDYTHQLLKGLETGMCIAYARPFGKNNNHPGKHELDITHLTEEQKEIHREILDLRDARYAHTDDYKKTGRAAGSNLGSYWETWQPLHITKINELLILCEINRDSWRNQADIME
jgi:hypothetical protein